MAKVISFEIADDGNVSANVPPEASIADIGGVVILLQHIASMRLLEQTQTNMERRPSIVRAASVPDNLKTVGSN